MNQRSAGFTLVEAMVSAALVGLIAIGILTVIISFANNSARFTAREDFNDLGKILQLILSDDALCVQALRSVSNGPVAYTPNAAREVDVDRIINPGASSALITSNSNYGAHLFIGQLKLIEDPGVAPITEDIALADKATGNYVTKTYTSYRVTLRVPGRSTSADSVAAADNSIPRDNIAPLQIPLKVYVANGSNDIDRCMLASAANQTCIGLGGTYDTTVGRCVFPLCDRARQVADINRWRSDADPTNDGNDYRCQGVDDAGNVNSNCTPPIYFWGFQANGAVTMPVCICSDSCSSPSSGGGY